MKLIYSFTAAALAVGGMVAITTPAHASSAQCPDDKVCLFSDADLVGYLGYRSVGGGLVAVSTSANNVTSSWINKNASTSARSHDAANGQSPCHTMGAGNHLSSMPSDQNNTLSSWATDGSCSSV